LFKKGKTGINRIKYDKFLKKIYENAKTKLGDNLIIYCNKSDTAKVKKLFKTTKDFKTTIIGGLILEDAEKTVRIDKSFEKLLEDKKHVIQKKFLQGLK
jgi:vacuolar-type H+-ATPase subunit E/Vma4